MKRLSILFLALIAFSCGDDDGVTVPTQGTYVDTNPNLRTVNILQDCDVAEPVFYCLTEETYQTLVAQYTSPCVYVTFTDIDGIERSGHIGNIGTGGGCTRNNP